MHRVNIILSSPSFNKNIAQLDTWYLHFWAKVSWWKGNLQKEKRNKKYEGWFTYIYALLTMESPRMGWLESYFLSGT